MTERLRVAVLFGGRSAEHEVSLQSAKNIIEAIDKTKYDVVPIGIDKTGTWYLSDASEFLLHADNPELIALNKLSQPVALMAAEKSPHLIDVRDHRPAGAIDVVFPVLHGPFGEDGTVQGLLKLAELPFVGASVLGSAVGMDKDVMKRLLKEAGIAVADFLVLHRASAAAVDFAELRQRLGLPVFVKPANLGSSVGISKAGNERAFRQALDTAFSYDRKVLVEANIEGREIECSVLGNSEPRASLPGEIVPRREFYSYEAKYIDQDGALLRVPADLPSPVIREVQRLAVQTFKVLCCEGMARVDLFLTGEQRLVVNELNTIPGFTKNSLYPRLWEASGVSCAELIDTLIQLALQRFEEEKRLTRRLY